MDGFKGYYAKWDLRQIPYDLTYVQNLKNKTNETEQKQRQRTKEWLPERSERGVK